MTTSADVILIPGTLFYLWMGYGAMVVLASLTIFALRLRVVRDGRIVKHPHGKGFFAALSALMLIIMTYLFYKSFYAIEPGTDEVRLVYPWPRPSIGLLLREIEGGRIVPQRRRVVGGLATLEITARGRVYGSTGIETSDVIQQLKMWLAKWEAQRYQTK